MEAGHLARWSFKIDREMKCSFVNEKVSTHTLEHSPIHHCFLMFSHILSRRFLSVWGTGRTRQTRALALDPPNISHWRKDLNRGLTA